MGSFQVHLISCHEKNSHHQKLLVIKESTHRGEVAEGIVEAVVVFLFFFFVFVVFLL